MYESLRQQRQRSSTVELWFCKPVNSAFLSHERGTWRTTWRILPQECPLHGQSEYQMMAKVKWKVAVDCWTIHPVGAPLFGIWQSAERVADEVKEIFLVADKLNG